MTRGAIGAAVACFLIAGLYISLPWIFPLPGDLLEISGSVSTRYLDREGRILHESLSGEEQRLHWVELGDISPHVVRAFIYKEDSRFYRHPGIDGVAVARALWQNLRAGRVVSGGSTITQQLARIIVGSGTRGSGPRTLTVKVHEAILAVRMEREFDKETILTHYLNRAPFGNQVRGVEKAAQLYFHKSAAGLSPAESAFLAVIPRSPTNLNPYRNLNGVRVRARTLIERMEKEKVIDWETARLALTEPLEVRERRSPFRAPHLIQYLARNLAQANWNVTPSAIRTTLDSRLQQEAEAALDSELAPLKKHGVNNGAVVVLENSTGNVLAFVGSRDFTDDEIQGQNNGATSPRQPGSALKPFTYALGLTDGMTLSSIVADIEAHFPALEGNYSPRNFNNRFYGPVRVREALANSLNVSAVKTAQRVGVESLMEFLEALGITTLTREPEHYGLGLTLGNGEVPLLELTAAYAALARGGLGVTPRFVEEVRDERGNPITIGNLSTAHRVMNREVAWLITDVLSDENARIGSFGVLNPLNFPFKVAAKTGTSWNFTDNWTMGFTNEITVGVWVGNFNGSPMRGVSGITGAGPVFNRVMSAAMEGRKKVWPEKPDGIVQMKVCTLSGKRTTDACRGAILESFVDGTQPTDDCSYHRLIAVDGRNGLLAHANTPERFLRMASYAVLPAPYAEWARAEGVPSPPADHSPLNAGNVILTARRLSLLYPDGRQRYIMDPFIPEKYQTILPRIDSDEPLARVETILDGLVLGSSRILEPLRVPLTPGLHKLMVRDPVSGTESQVVSFEVVRPEEVGYFW